jgi:hypothetical protein
MQVAAATHQPPSAVLDQHDPTESTRSHVLHPHVTDACDDEQPFGATSGGLVGVRNLWAEVRRQWLGGVVPA